MALSSCSKCGKNSFELVEAEPTYSNYKLLYLQCSSCGAVVGVIDYSNIGTRINELEKKIDDLDNKMDQVKSAMRNK